MKKLNSVPAKTSTQQKLEKCTTYLQSKGLKERGGRVVAKKMLSVWNKQVGKQGTVKLVLKVLLGVKVCSDEYYLKFSATSTDFALKDLQ